jgi:hypothetical protein
MCFCPSIRLNVQEAAGKIPRTGLLISPMAFAPVRPHGRPGRLDFAVPALRILGDPVRKAAHGPWSDQFGQVNLFTMVFQLPFAYDAFRVDFFRKRAGKDQQVSGPASTSVSITFALGLLNGDTEWVRKPGVES